MPKTIIFAGAYGIHSQGDDAALVVLLEMLQRRYPDLNGVVICRHAENNFYEPYGLSSLPNLEYENKESSRGRWFRGFNFDDDRTDLKLLQKRIAQADLLILGAGNAFVDYSIDLLKGPIPYFVILSMMARMTGTPVMWFAMSVGPLTTEYGQNMTRLASILANTITVRDQHSVHLLKEIGCQRNIKLLPDPVLGLRPEKTSKHPVYIRAHRQGNPVVVVSVRAISDAMGIPSEKYLSAMANLLDHLVKNLGSTLLFIPQCTYEHGEHMEDDRVVGREIICRMEHANATFSILDHLTVKETLSLYFDAEFAVCTRLHANVYAAIQGVPSLAINYNPKIAGFMEWLQCKKYIIELRQLEEIDSIMCQVNKLLLNKVALKKSVSQKITKAQKEIEQYVHLALRTIQEPRENKKQWAPHG